MRCLRHLYGRIDGRSDNKAQRYGLRIAAQALGILAGQIRSAAMSQDEVLHLIGAMQGALAKKMPPELLIAVEHGTDNPGEAG